MEDLGALTPPELLSPDHKIDDFQSGEPAIDDWLRRRAFANQHSGASRTYVLTASGSVIGYYALASGVVALESAPGRFRRNMPAPIPVVVLARLGVDHRWQGRGLGRALFQDACRRVINAADVIGIRGIIVHAILEAARNFYLALGFDPSQTDPMFLLITLADIRAAFPAT